MASFLCVRPDVLKKTGELLAHKRRVTARRRAAASAPGRAAPPPSPRFPFPARLLAAPARWRSLRQRCGTQRIRRLQNRNQLAVRLVVLVEQRAHLGRGRQASQVRHLDALLHTCACHSLIIKSTTTQMCKVVWRTLTALRWLMAGCSAHLAGASVELRLHACDAAPFEPKAERAAHAALTSRAAP